MKIDPLNPNGLKGDAYLKSIGMVLHKGYLVPIPTPKPTPAITQMIRIAPTEEIPSDVQDFIPWTPPVQSVLPKSTYRRPSAFTIFIRAFQPGRHRKPL